MWILNGTKIIFLASNWENPELGQVLSQLKVINVDGSNEQVLYNKELFYNSITASDTGQIIFSTYDLAQDNTEHLYLINPDQKEPAEIVILNPLPRPEWDTSPRFKYSSLSPDGRSLVFEDYGLHNGLPTVNKLLLLFLRIQPDFILKSIYTS
jgi:hypothetical protein